MPTELTFHNARGLRIAADHYPAGGDCMVVMANDLLTHRRWRGRYPAIANALNAAGISALSFDYCGTGASDDDLLCAETIVEDLRSAMAHAQRLGARHIALWGHGLLSGFCLDLAHPSVATVVLSAAAVESLDLAQVAGFEPHELEELRSNGEVVGASMDPGVRPRQVLTATLIRDLAAVDLDGRVRGAQCPVLLIHGNSEGDSEELKRLSTSRRAITELPRGSQLSVIEGASHSFAGHFDALSALGLSWLRQHFSTQ